MDKEGRPSSASASSSFFSVSKISNSSSKATATPPADGRRRRRWSTARRVQLAVQSSLRSPQVNFDGATADSAAAAAIFSANTTAAAGDCSEPNTAAITRSTTENIDEALRSLYDNENQRPQKPQQQDGMTQLSEHGSSHSHKSAVSASYLPSPNADWLLDYGTLRNHAADRQETARLWEELHANPVVELERHLREREEQRARERRLEQELEGWDAFPGDAAPVEVRLETTTTTTTTCKVQEEIEDKNMEDDFGDFQTASAVEEEEEEQDTVGYRRANSDDSNNDDAADPHHTPIDRSEIDVADPSMLTPPPQEPTGVSSQEDLNETRDLVRHADQLLRRWNPTSGDDVNDDGLGEDYQYGDGGGDHGISPASIDTPDLLRTSEEMLLQCQKQQPQPMLLTSGFAVGDDDYASFTEEKKTDPLLGSPSTATIRMPRDFSSSPSRPGEESESSSSSGSSHHKRHSLLRRHCRRLSEPSPNSTPPTDAAAAASHHNRRPSAPSTFCFVVEDHPLWLRLPLEDLSTLEARFTRRRQQQYEWERRCPPLSPTTTDAMEEEAATTKRDLDLLPGYFFTAPDLDDTVSLLESLPWHYVLPITGRGPPSTATSGKRRQNGNGCKDDFDPTEYLALWDDHTTTRLCELDSAMEQIQGDLLKQIQPHQPGLQRANDLIHEWEKNLRLAFMYYGRARESTEKAMGQQADATGLAGHSVLLQTWQHREEYAALNCVLEELDGIWTREKDLLHRIDCFDIEHANALNEYYAVMASARELEAAISSERFTSLQCLEDMRARLSKIGERFWERLLSLARSLVARCCRRKDDFDWTEYERLVQAVLDLHTKASADKSIEEDLSSSWTHNLLAALTYEADRALTMALLEPTDVEDSDFEQELRELATEVDRHWGDSAKLRTLTHNLVTIRFVFESKRNYLPKVIHRLCNLLAKVLHVHFLFRQWHREPFGDYRWRQKAPDRHEHAPMNERGANQGDLLSILSGLDASVQTFWDHAEGVVVLCLDEYLHFAPKRSLFKRAGKAMDDSCWQADLDSLHQVFVLTDRFIPSLKDSFLGDEKVDASQLVSLRDGSHGLICEKLSDIFRRHLRSLHVEAMNTIGRRLANETWVLGSFSKQSAPERSDDRHSPTVESILLEAITTCIGSLAVVDTSSRFAETENPFGCRGADASATSIRETTTMHRLQECGITLSDSPLYKTLGILISDSGSGVLQRLAPETVTNELVVWFARLLTVMYQLPLIVEDVSAVFANLCDLYLTTVLRLCSGSGKSERLLLGAVDPTPLLVAQRGNAPPPVSDENVAGAPIFGSFRAAKRRTSGAVVPARQRPVLPKYLEAEICAPLPRDHPQVAKLKAYILQAQDSLLDVVSLDMVDNWLEDPDLDSPEEQGCEVARILEKREAAIWSCLVVVALVDASCTITSTILREAFRSSSDSKLDVAIAPLQAYCRTVLDVTPTLATVARQIACNRAVAGADVVKEIIKVGPGWKECKLHEFCNDYVEDLCERCSLTWGYLAVSAKLPPAAMKITWEHIVSTAYMSLLDGFSRVPFCSTEGRALMALDLASLASGLSPASVAERLESVVLANKPPSVNPDCNMRYVDTYIKVFYYPKDDVMDWIAEHHKSYKLNHALALAIASATGNPEQSPERTLVDLVEDVKSLYSDDANEEADRGEL